MVSLVLYGIIAIALAASAGYAMLVVTSTAQQTTQMQENSVRLEQAATALRASLRAINNDGVLYAPAGTPPSATPGVGAAYTTLPGSLGVVGSSPWGSPFLYCPVTQIPSAGFGSADPIPVTSPDGTTYTVSSYTDPNSGVKYITNSGLAGLPNIGSAGGYLGFIVSSLNVGHAPPACNQITFTNGNPLVAQGSVRAITGGLPFNQRAIASTDRLEIYAVPDGTAVTGDNSGSSTVNPTNLSNAVSIWSNLQPRLTIVYLQSGVNNYTLSATDAAELNGELNRPNSYGEMPNLVFAKVNDSNPSQPTLTTQGPITLKTPVVFDNVILNLSANNLTSYAPLTFKASTITGPSTISIYGAKLDMIDVISMTNVSLNAYQSKLAIYNIVTPAPINIVTYSNAFVNSSISLYDSDLRFGQNTNVIGAPSSRYSLATTSSTNNALYAENSSISLDVSTGLTLSGMLVLRNSKYTQEGTLIGNSVTLDGGSSMLLLNGTGGGNSVTLQPTVTNVSALAISGNSSVSNNIPFIINTSGTIQSVLATTGGSFNQYGGVAGNLGSLTINQTGSGIAVVLLSNSSLNQYAGNINVTTAGSQGVTAYNGSSVNLNSGAITLSSTASALNSGIDSIYVEGSNLNTSAETITANGAGFRSALLTQGGRINLIGSTLNTTTAFSTAAIYLTRASGLDAFNSTINRTGSTYCIFLENPSFPSTLIPAGQAQSNFAVLYPTLSNSVDSGPSNGIGANAVNIVSNGVAPSNGTVTGTLDPATFDTYLNSQNVGMAGNLNLVVLTCH